MNLINGKSTLMRLPYQAARMSVGDARIADVILLNKNEVYMVGKAVGSTNLILWNKNNDATIIDLSVVMDTACCAPASMHCCRTRKTFRSAPPPTPSSCPVRWPMPPPPSKWCRSPPPSCCARPAPRSSRPPPAAHPAWAAPPASQGGEWRRQWHASVEPDRSARDQYAERGRAATGDA
ncbi:pilus assembly protein N-terminal domain-containing protein [Massilia sp. B-10]|nr:pilus assembly protein N-terminal domain-containing protein [Massilia sp. B-10]